MASWDNREVTDKHLLPYVDSSTAQGDVQAALKTLPFERNIFKVRVISLDHTFTSLSPSTTFDLTLLQLTANAPAFFPTFMKLLTCSWSPERTLRSRDWQTIVLRTAATLDAPYEWDVNEPVGRVFGFTDEHLKHLRSGDLSSTELFTDRQRLVSSIVEDLCLKDRVPEEKVRRAKEVFGDTGLMELFFIQSIYAYLARTMNSCKIDFDEPIPGLLDILRKYNGPAIEKENLYTD